MRAPSRCTLIVDAAAALAREVLLAPLAGRAFRRAVEGGAVAGEAIAPGARAAVGVGGAAIAAARAGALLVDAAAARALIVVEAVASVGLTRRAGQVRGRVHVNAIAKRVAATPGIALAGGAERAALRAAAHVIEAAPGRALLVDGAVFTVA